MTAKARVLDQPDLIADQDFFNGEEEAYYYYDDHFGELKWRDMPGTEHQNVKRYLMAVLLWYFKLKKWAVYEELNFYQTDNQKEKPLYPDIAIIKGQEQQSLTSYRLGETGPAPNLIIEIVSTKTRSRDLEVKPKHYAGWGTAEYFAYDPRLNRRHTTPRLLGWRLEATSKQYRVIEAETDGRIWSEQLECWLVPEKELLRLYSRDGQRWLNEAEAEHHRAERLAEKLRRLGQNPDDL